MSTTLQAPLVLTLPYEGPDVAAVVGGKAGGIDRLLRAGFDVPPTTVLGAAAYRRFLAADGPRQLVEDIVADRADPDADAVDAVFLQTPMPADVAECVLSAARALGAGAAIALRSSATVEDMQGFSFAGQYRSFLDVDPDDAETLLRTVRLVWASLWHPAPRAYRRAWGFREDNAAMAVLMMRMVAARQAGVAFSVDPGGSVGSVRVEAVSGLGDDLVSGRRTPEVFLVPRSSPGAAGTPEPAASAAALALRVEAALGGPQDIEWAWDGERVWLVQARPITAADGDQADTPPDTAELSPAGVEEMLPGVLPPLVWDVASFCVEEGFRSLLADAGVALPEATGPHVVLRRVRGRAALDLDLLKAAAATLPGVQARDVELGYFGTATGPPAGDTAGVVTGPATTRRRRHSLRHDLRLLGARRRALAESDIVLVAAADLLSDFPSPTVLTDAELLARRLRLLDLGARATAAEVAIAAVGAAAFRRLEAMLGKHLEPAAAAGFAQRLAVGGRVSAPASPQSSMSVFGGPTWKETSTECPSPAPTPGAPRWESAEREVEALLTASPGWRRARILTGQFVDVRLHSLRRAAAEARDRLAQRDAVKAAVLAIGGLVRDVHLEVGHRLVARGLIVDAADIDLLREHEMRAALTQGSAPAPAQLVVRRRHLVRYDESGPLPARFVGTPTVDARASTVNGDVLAGWAASPGRYTGRARVLIRPDKAAMTAGDVVVARATDSAWTPVFLLAGAIVVERGGPLSHAALVARELGIPAVLNVADAAAVLDGRRVTVDGDRGEVVVHDPTVGSNGSAGAGR